LKKIEIRALKFGEDLFFRDHHNPIKKRENFSTFEHILV